MSFHDTMGPAAPLPQGARWCTRSPGHGGRAGYTGRLGWRPAILVFLGCAGDGPSGLQLGPVTSLTVAERPLALGGTGPMRAVARDALGQAHPDALFSWSSSDEAAVAIDANGVVTGVAVGSAVITASAFGLSDAVTITVTRPGVLGLELIATVSTPAVAVAFPPGDPSRLLVVEQQGVVHVIEDGTIRPTPFLDVTHLVSRRGGEQGLVDLTFHPDFQQNGYLYVVYTDKSGAVLDDQGNILKGNSVVVRYTASGDPIVADPTSALVILMVEQPFVWHNVTHVEFGPDRYLYIGAGDGGDAADPFGNGQNLGTLLGSILRIDVDAASPYAVPSDNPFVPGSESKARPEIWAYGLRMPWRFSFDRATRDLYIADVGESTLEEVSVEPAPSAGGKNYGWRIMEGHECYGGGPACDQSGLIAPVFDYTRDDGCSVIGGYVYRGSQILDLVGQYVYGDYCGGWVRSFRYDGQDAVDHHDWGQDIDLGAEGGITSFGEGPQGELYVMTYAGSLYRIVPAQD